MEKQKSTIRIECTKDDGQTDIFDLHLMYGELQKALGLAIMTLDVSAEGLEHIGEPQNITSKAARQTAEMARKVLEKSKKIPKNLPVIEERKKEEPANWRTSCEVFANGTKIGHMSRSVKSLDAAIAWNKKMQNGCLKDIESGFRGFTLVESTFNDKTGHGILRFKDDNTGFQTRFNVVKNGKIYKPEEN